MARRTKKEIQEISKEVKNGIKKFVRYQEGADLYSMGLHTFQQLSKEAGAVYKIYDDGAIDEYAAGTYQYA